MSVQSLKQRIAHRQPGCIDHGSAAVVFSGSHPCTPAGRHPVCCLYTHELLMTCSIMHKIQCQYNNRRIVTWLRIWLTNSVPGVAGVS